MRPGARVGGVRLSILLTSTIAFVSGFQTGCEDAPNVSPVDAPRETAEAISPFAHIKPQPPGGKWIATARNQQNFVRRFKETGTVYLVGVSVARLVAEAYGASPGDVVWNPESAEAHFDVVVRPEDGSPETAQRMLRSLIAERLGLEVKRAQTKRMSMVLAPAQSGVLLEPSSSRAGTLELGEGRLRAVGASIAQLVELLGRDSRIPIVDETGLQDRYDYLLEWDTTKGAYAFIQSLGDIGLALSPGMRVVESLVVEEAPFLEDVSFPMPLASGATARLETP